MIGLYNGLMLKYFLKIFIANKRFPSELYVFLTDTEGAGYTEICTRFDVLLSALKFECSLFLYFNLGVVFVCGKRIY